MSANPHILLGEYKSLVQMQSLSVETSKKHIDRMRYLETRISEALNFNQSIRESVWGKDNGK